MAKYIEHKKININNSLNQEIVIFYSKHYGEEWYSLISIDGKDAKNAIAYETLDSLIKQTEML
jgi:hypothetical protein